MMKIHHLLASFVLYGVTTALNLPLGAINVVVLTDVHSWVAGHGNHELVDNADYGDVLSFYERLQRQAPDKDFFLVNDGDFMDGTGLSTYPPTHLTPILERMPWDAFNMGNHELYFNSTIEHITQEGGFIDYLNGKYLTSNVIMRATHEPIGSRYTYLHGKNSNSTILSFGFLFDFTENCPITAVESVNKTVQSKWFTDVLQRGSFDAILVLAHMDVQDPLVYTILDAIRQLVSDNMPVLFITGHTHYRGFVELDENAISFEAGRYLDTVGFVSFPTKETATDTTLFHHVFLDANVETLKKTLGVDTLLTPSGAALKSLILETQRELGLLRVLGCAPESYYLENGLKEPQSLWALYLSEVIEKHFFQYEASFIFVQGTGAFRYSLLQGNVTVDDVIAVSPFNDTVYMVAELISGTHLLQILGTPNQVDGNSKLPSFAVAGTIEPQYYYDLFTVGFELAYFQDAIYNVTGSRFDPVEQYLDGKLVTTTGLWMDYVSTSLTCDKKSGVEDMNPPWLVVFFTMVAVIVFFGLRVRRRYAKREYEIIMDQPQGNDECLYRAVV